MNDDVIDSGDAEIDKGRREAESRPPIWPDLHPSVF